VIGGGGVPGRVRTCTDPMNQRKLGVPLVFTSSTTE
jgi:hypothetical protein